MPGYAASALGDQTSMVNAACSTVSPRRSSLECGPGAGDAAECRFAPVRALRQKDRLIGEVRRGQGGREEASGPKATAGEGCAHVKSWRLGAGPDISSYGYTDGFPPPG